MDKRESAKNETARIEAKGYFPPKREIRVYYKGVCVESRIAKDAFLNEETGGENV